jgi:hypothetical protein
MKEQTKRDLLHSMKCKIGEKSKRLSVTMETRARSEINTGTGWGGGRQGEDLLSLSLSRGTGDVCDVMHHIHGALSQTTVVHDMTEVCHTTRLNCSNIFSILIGALTMCLYLD